MKKGIIRIGLVLLVAIVLTIPLNVKPAQAYQWTTSELSWSPGAETAGWNGWWFRWRTDWFQFTFTGIDTTVINNFVRVGFHFHVTTRSSGEGGVDGLIDVVINPGLIPTTAYGDVLLDNVDPNNHIYGIGDPSGSYLTYGEIDVPKSYIIAGQLIIRVERHTDTNAASSVDKICTEQPIEPPNVPTGVYENDDAHTIHLGVWCQDGAGGRIVTSEGGYGYVSVTADKQLPTLTQWGLIILLVVLAGIATWVVLKRRRIATA